MRGRGRPTELLQRVTQPGKRVRSDTAPRRWTVPVRLLPRTTERMPAEAATGTLPPRLRQKNPEWRQRSERGREGGRGMWPGGPPGPAPQPGGPALRPQKPPPPPQPAALHRGSIRNPRPDPGDPLLLRPGQTGTERGRGTEKRRGRGRERGTENARGLPGGAGPEAQGGAAPPTGKLRTRMYICWSLD